MTNAIFFTMLIVCACAAAVGGLSAKAGIGNILLGSSHESGSTKEQRYWFVIGEVFMLMAIVACYGEFDLISP